MTRYSLDPENASKCTFTVFILHRYGILEFNVPLDTV